MFTKITPNLCQDNASVGDAGLEENQIWLVEGEASDRAVNALTASASGVTIPAYLSQHQSITTLFVVNKSVVRKGNCFIVTVKYGIPQRNFEQPSPEATTTKWNKRVTVSSVSSVEETNRTFTGKIISNSLGDAFKPGLEKEYYDEQINISFSTRTVDVGDLGSSIGCINNDDVPITISQGNYYWIYPAKTLKFTSLSYSTATAEDGTFYWDVNLILTHRSQFLPGTETELGWTKLVPNKGFRYKDGSGNIQKSNTEVYLNSDGTLVPSGSDAHLLSFQVEDEINFTGTGGILDGI